MSSTFQRSPASGLPADDRPLCVDLDGTLVSTDLLWEAVLLVAKHSPFALLLLPLWLAGGKAKLKAELAKRVTPDATSLPYREGVLAYLKEQAASGRALHLVTASPQPWADAVAAHLGVFQSATGSTPTLNLKSEAKGAHLKERFGGEFDYLGDSSADVAVWRLTGRPLLVNASSGVARAAAAVAAPVVVVPRAGGALKAMIKALRPHQWAKNALLGVPVVVAHKYTDVTALLHTAVGIFAFSLCASSVYILNDLLDLEADRRHRSKKNRPFAKGTLSIPRGIALGTGVLVVGVGISVAVLPLPFTGVLLGYLLLTTLYSVWLKRKLIVDVLMLASLFTYRVLAGGVAADVVVSFWLLAFSMFFFTGLAFAKRYSELAALREKTTERVPGRNYQVDDLAVLTAVGPASGLCAVLVFALYIKSPEVSILYPRPEALWLICPILLYWVTRVWFLAGRAELDDDPIVFALRDRISWLAGFACVACVLGARF